MLQGWVTACCGAVGIAGPSSSFCSPYLSTLCLGEAQMPLEDPGGKSPKLLHFRGYQPHTFPPAWLEWFRQILLLSVLFIPTHLEEMWRNESMLEHRNCIFTQPVLRWRMILHSQFQKSLPKCNDHIKGSVPLFIFIFFFHSEWGS